MHYIRTYSAFLLWVLNKATFGSGELVSSLHEFTKDCLSDRPFLASLLYFLLSAVLLLVLIIVGDVSGWSLTTVFYSVSTVSVLFYLIVGVQVLWDAYQNEQQAVVDELTGIRRNRHDYD